MKKKQEKSKAIFYEFLLFFDLKMPIYLTISDSWLRRLGSNQRPID